MYKIIQCLLIVVVSYAMLTGCTHQTTKPTQTEANSQNPPPEYTGYLLKFSEKKRHEPESNVRMIITQKFLRIDEGPQSKDFILFNRDEKAIFNVVEEDESVLVMKPGEIELKPTYPLMWIVESQSSNAVISSKENAPAAATHFRYKLNNQDCYNIVTVNEVMNDVLTAMKEYRQTLANELKRFYRPAKNDECYEAINIFDATNHLQNGFPIREWSSYGYQRFLVDFRKKIIFPASLFELPTVYRKYSI